VYYVLCVLCVSVYFDHCQDEANLVGQLLDLVLDLDRVKREEEKRREESGRKETRREEENF